MRTFRKINISANCSCLLNREGFSFLALKGLHRDCGKKQSKFSYIFNHFAWRRWAILKNILILDLAYTGIRDDSDFMVCFKLSNCHFQVKMQYPRKVYRTSWNICKCFFVFSQSLLPPRRLCGLYHKKLLRVWHHNLFLRPDGLLASILQIPLHILSRSTYLIEFQHAESGMVSSLPPPPLNSA